MNKNLVHPILLGIAVMLVAISYKMEQIAYSAVLTGIILLGIKISVFMAIAFNAAKLSVAWVLARGKAGTKSMATLAKLCLISLSMLASFIVVGYYTDAPNVGKVERDHLHQAKIQHEERLQERRAVFESAKQEIVQNFAQLRKHAGQFYKLKLAELERQRQQEMRNTYKNSDQFIGPRYKEIVRQIKQTNDAFDSRIDELNRQEQAALQNNSSKEMQAVQQLQAQREKELTAVSEKSYYNDPAAQNPYLLAPTHLANKIMGTHLTPMHIALLFSLLATLAVEIGPLVLVGFIASEIPQDEEEGTHDVAVFPKAPTEPNETDGDQGERSSSSDANVTPFRVKDEMRLD